jgi:hypothetical protein
MANVKITDLPAAQPLTGAESVPVVQDGITVRTTTGAIAGSPSQTQTFITVNQEPTLPNSRALSSTFGIGVTDNGAQSTISLSLQGAAASLNGSGTGFQVKTDSDTVIAREIAVSGSGLVIADGDGQAGDPTISLDGIVSSLANVSGAGFAAFPNNGTVVPRVLTGTVGEIDITNGTGASGDPTFSLADTAVTPGTYGSSTQVPVVTIDDKGRVTSASNAPITSGGTVTYVSALTLGTSGTDLSSTVTDPTTTPVITLNVPTASATNRGVLSPADWTTFNNKGDGTVTSVTGTAPIVSSGGNTPAISIPKATSSVDGYLSSTDWSTFNSKGNGTVTAVSVVPANGFAGTSSGGATPAITLTTTVTGILKGNGTSISAATSGTDYAPATSGTSILYGDGSGGFSNVTIGSGVSFSGGSLSATGSGGTVTSITAGTGLTGGTITSSGTVAIDNTVVATLSDTQTLTNKSISGASNTLTNIGNSSLTNSSVTINGSSVSLGGSTTVTAVNPNALTIGTGLSGTSYDGSSPVTVAIDSTVATLNGTQTFTNKSISGSTNTLTNIPNSALTNSSLTIGSTPISLGGTATTLAGLTSITLTQDPVSDLQVATKQYVDSIASGLNYHQPVNYASTAALPAYTYNNGSSGVGATITANANGALSFGGGSPTVGQRLLVKDESGANEPYNGIYTVTQTGSLLLPFILTRATDYDTSGSGTNEIDAGDYVLVLSGTNASTAWVQQTPLPITVGTTALVFLQFNAPITYTAGTGLNLSPSTTFNISNTGVTAATYGSASSVPTIAVNAQGQITSASNSSIAINGNQITSGTVGSSYISGSYTGITGVGTLTAGTWNATPIGNAYLANSSITVNGNSVSLGGSTTVTANTPNSLTFDNSGTGATSGTAFNGGTAYTISYNTVGASPLAGSSSLTTVGTISSGTWNGSTIGVDYGGTGQTSYTDGQLLIGNSTGNTLTKSTLTAGSGITITNGSGSITISSSAGGGTVTSVGQTFTGGLISVSGSPVTTSGTLALTVAGTSGGIPYFSSASTWASSAVLDSNALVVGGGAGVAPSTVTTGTGVVTALGVNTGTAGSFVVNGGALGTPSAGVVTNLTGTASININGTVGATTPNTGSFTTLDASGAVTFSSTTNNINIGTSLTTGGVQIGGLNNTANIFIGRSLYSQAVLIASGTTALGTTKTVSIGTGSGVGITTTINIGTNNGGTTINLNGTVTLSSALSAANGGTGQSSYTTGDLLYASSSSALSKLADVATGNALISGGVGAAPSWGKIDLATHISGTLSPANGGTGVANNAASTLTISGNFATTLTVSGTTGVTLPTTGTLATLAGSETFTNKTLTNPTVTNYVESVVAIGNSGTSQVLSLTSGTVQTVTMTGNCTFTMPTATAGKSFILIVSTGAGGFTGTFTSVKWPSNTPPTLTTTASRWDILTFVADGTNWYGAYQQAYQ